MRRTLLAAFVCIAGLVTGCGSGTKTVTRATGATTQSTSSGSTSPPSAVAALAGRAATLGPPPPGTRYNAVNHAFLQRLATVLGHELESGGLHDVNVTCTASVATQARCRASGTSAEGRSNSGTATVTIDRTTGQLHFGSP